MCTAMFPSSFFMTAKGKIQLIQPWQMSKPPPALGPDQLCLQLSIIFCLFFYHSKVRQRVVLAEIKCAKIFYHLLEYSWMLFLQKNSLLKIFIEHQQYIRFCSKYGCLSFYSNKNEKKPIFIGFNNEHELGIPLNSVTPDTVFSSGQELCFSYQNMHSPNTMPCTQ